MAEKRSPSTRYFVEKGGRTHHITIDHNEANLHTGSSFTIFKGYTLDAAGYVDLTMTVPDGFDAHMLYQLDAPLAVQLQVFADSVVTGGAVALARNRHEGSTNTDTVSIRTGGTVGTVGTELANVIFGLVGVAPVGPHGAGSHGTDEIIWPPNSVRRFRFTSLADGNNLVLRMNFLMDLFSNPDTFG